VVYVFGIFRNQEFDITLQWYRNQYMVYGKCLNDFKKTCLRSGGMAQVTECFPKHEPWIQTPVPSKNVFRKLELSFTHNCVKTSGKNIVIWMEILVYFICCEGNIKTKVLDTKKLNDF
jgi:hypothetical protein